MCRAGKGGRLPRFCVRRAERLIQGGESPVGSVGWAGLGWAWSIEVLRRVCRPCVGAGLLVAVLGAPRDEEARGEGRNLNASLRWLGRGERGKMRREEPRVTWARRGAGSCRRRVATHGLRGEGWRLAAACCGPVKPPGGVVAGAARWGTDHGQQQRRRRGLRGRRRRRQGQK